jgi:hypothetical protein
MTPIDTPDGFTTDDGTALARDIIRRLEARRDMNRRNAQYLRLYKTPGQEAFMSEIRAEAYEMAIHEVRSAAKDAGLTLA